MSSESTITTTTPTITEAIEPSSLTSIPTPATPTVTNEINIELDHNKLSVDLESPGSSVHGSPTSKISGDGHLMFDGEQKQHNESLTKDHNAHMVVEEQQLLSDEAAMEASSRTLEDLTKDPLSAFVEDHSVTAFTSGAAAVVTTSTTSSVDESSYERVENPSLVVVDEIIQQKQKQQQETVSCHGTEAALNKTPILEEDLKSDEVFVTEEEPSSLSEKNTTARKITGTPTIIEEKQMSTDKINNQETSSNETARDQTTTKSPAIVTEELQHHQTPLLPAEYVKGSSSEKVNGNKQQQQPQQKQQQQNADNLQNDNDVATTEKENSQEQEKEISIKEKLPFYKKYQMEYMAAGGLGLMAITGVILFVVFNNKRNGATL